MTTKERDELIWKRIKEYAQIIADDHHKTKDGYFAIGREYHAYSGKDMTWVSLHHGYLHEWHEEFETFQEAQNHMLSKLAEIIREEKEYRENTPNEH